jgi:prepilin-type processing-associated H-X9-DG protein
MKLVSPSAKNRALTLLELLVLIVVIAVLTAMLLPTSGGAARGYATICGNHLKQIGNNFSAWSHENEDRFPMQVSTVAGGSMELISGGSAIVHFRTLTNSGVEFRRANTVTVTNNSGEQQLTRWSTHHGLDQQLLFCLSDRSRESSQWGKGSFDELADSDISYFVGVDASTMKPGSILSGDRSIELSGIPVQPGLLEIAAKSRVGWSTNLHPTFRRGNVLFSDGHVEFIKRLSGILEKQDAKPIRLAIP